MSFFILSYAGSQASVTNEKAVSMLTSVHCIWGLPLLLIGLLGTVCYFALEELMRFEQEIC